MAKKQTTVRLDEDLRDRLQQHAEARGVSEAELIRQAIVFWLGWLEGQAAAQAQAQDAPPSSS